MSKGRWGVVLLVIVLSGLMSGWLRDEGWASDKWVQLYPMVAYDLPDSQIGQTVEPMIKQASVEDAPNCVAMLEPDNAEPLWWFCDDGATSGNYDVVAHGAIAEATLGGQDLASMGVQIVYQLYSWPQRGGNVFNGVTSWGAGCSDGSQYWMADYAPYGWNNITSSMEAVGSCGTLTGYDLDSYGGTQHSVSPYGAELGIFDNGLNSSKAK